MAGKKHKRGKAFLVLFMISQLVLSVIASSTAYAAYIRYDDSYTYDGSTSSDGVAWGGSTLKTKLDSYPSNTMVECFDWCGDGTLDSCYGRTWKWFWESKSPLDKCKADSSDLKKLCDNGKCGNGAVGDWRSIGTGSAGSKWTCSIKSKYYSGCTGTGSYKSDNTNYKAYYITYPRQYDCDGYKTKTYDDRAYFGATIGVNIHSDVSCSGNRLCDQAKDDESADFGWYGKSKPSESCSVPNEQQDCDSDSDCFSGSACDCDSWFDCTYDLLSGDKDYCCPNGKKWDGSKCADPCKDNDGDGHKAGSCGGDDCNDNDASAWKKNSCGACAKEPSGLGNSCSKGTGPCKRTGKLVCDNSGTGTVCDATPGNPSTEVCDGVDNDCDGEVDDGVKNACGYCGAPPPEICWDGIDNNCDGQADENCCPASKPYRYDNDCHKCQSNEIECGSSCYSKTSSCSYGEPKCGSDKKAYCCTSTHPYNCPAADGCFQKAEYCDGRPIYKCQGEKWVCIDKGAAGTCIGNALKCCPKNNPYYWESDKRCHATQYKEVSCPIPDGTSAQCDCNTNADCPSSNPFCEENYQGHDSGYDGCLASEPEYCGNGICASNENYNSCQQDCTAPTGKINVDVSYSSKKPLSGAYVYLDSIPKGTTNSDGKASFEASYGNRNVKVDCPDKKFCGSRTVNVDGTEFVSFECGCNPLGDSDGDGNKDQEELLLGTDPNNANENFATAFSLFERPQSCLDIPGMLSIIWKNRNDLIQANELVLQAINTTTITTTNLQQNQSVLIQTLSKSEINAEIIKSDSTLIRAVETAEDIDGFFTDYGAVLVLTDYETSSTAIIAISATCVGTFAGNIYGAGTGLKDDVMAIGELLKGIWYVATNLDNTEKIGSDVTAFIKAIPGLFSNADKLFYDMIISILEKGQKITQKTGLFKSDRQAYLQFQIGFTNGFITGYVAEQIAAMFVGAGTILKALKGGKIVSVVGKTANLPEILAKITDKFGGEVASAVKKLKYAEKIVHWTEEEQNLLAELIKLGKNKNVKNIESWLDDAGEAGAKHATGRVGSVRKAGKLSEDQLAELMNTNLGRKTLTAADTTDELIVKQSKLVQKWGVKKADDVVSKCFLVFCDTSRVNDLNKILKAMPENLVDDLSPEKAVNFLGNKNVIKGSEELAKSFDSATIAKFASNADDFEALSKAAGNVKEKFGSLDNLYPALKSCFSVSSITTAAVCSPADIEKALVDLKGLGKFSDNVIDWTLDGMKAGVADITKVTPEQVARIVKGYGRNPFDVAMGVDQLLKVYKSPGQVTKIGSETINDVIVLKKGFYNKIDDVGFGSEKIIKKHTPDFVEHLGISDPDDILKVVEEVAEKGQKAASNDPRNFVMEHIVTRGPKTANVRVVINIDTSFGSITTGFPP